MPQGVRRQDVAVGRVRRRGGEDGRRGVEFLLFLVVVSYSSELPLCAVRKASLPECEHDEGQGKGRRQRSQLKEGRQQCNNAKAFWFLFVSVTYVVRALMACTILGPWALGLGAVWI